MDGLLRGDPVKRAQVNKTKFMHGHTTINEWRAQDDLDPIGPEGDQRFVPANLLPIGESGENGNGGLGGERPEADTSTLTVLRHEMRQIAREATESSDDGSDDVAAAWMAEVAQRLISKDRNDIRRAVAREANFVAWLDEHYAKFGESIKQACAGPAAALGVDPGAVATDYIETAKQRLLEACDGERQGFEGRIAAVLESWGHKYGELIHVG